MDRPIIFSAPMIRALLDGRKTQTRRKIRPAPEYCGGGRARDLQNWSDPDAWGWENHDTGTWDVLSEGFMGRPYYAPGDRLWVREAHALVPASAYRMSEGVAQAANPEDRDRAAIYREGFDRTTGGIRWRPSIHMPRWASRLTLHVTNVRVQRLQDITAEDCTAEGIPFEADALAPYEWSVARFADLWNSLHGPDAWDANPWVCAVSFEVERANIDHARAVA